MKIQISFDIRPFERTNIKKRIRSQFKTWVKYFDLLNLKLVFDDE